MPTNIEQNICDAIQIITNNAIAAAGFDRTIQGSILSCVNESTGKYKIRYQDSNIYAYSTDINKKYSRGTQVYVLVPCGDMSKNKTILGEVGAISAYNPDEGFDASFVTYERSSENLIKITSELEEYEVGLNSLTFDNYIDPDHEELNMYKEIYCPYPSSIDTNNPPSTIVTFIDKEAIKNYAKESTYFYLGATFTTSFKDNQLTKGNYGIRVNIKCENPNIKRNKDRFFTRTYVLDLEHGIDGNPYYLKSGSYKYTVFQIPENFVELISAEIFVQGFDKGEDDAEAAAPGMSEPDIRIKNIGLYTANSVAELIGGNGIILTYPSGRSIFKNSEFNNLAVSATVVENSKVMADDQHSFYWFKRDLSVTGEGKEGYNREYGRTGWYCLNQKNEVGWIPATNKFDKFGVDTLLLDIVNEFKVIAVRTVGNTAVVYEREFTLFNYEYNYLIDIYSSKYQNFSLNRRITDLDLICRIRNNNEEQQEIYSTNYDYNRAFVFYWYAKVDGIEYSGPAILDRFKLDDENKPEFSGGNQSFNNPLHDGNGRKISNISLNGVKNTNEGVVFGCTVKKIVPATNTEPEKYINLKTVFVNIGIDQFSNKPYTLRITNRNQVFQYDEYNKSPYYQGNTAPKQLGLELIDNQLGTEIDIAQTIREGKLEIAWEPPKDLETNSMLVIASNELDGINSVSVNDKIFYLNYNFKISETFHRSFTSNQIKVKVSYEGLILQDQTEFIFTKQGQYGTNGTEYFARITLIDGEIPRWVVFSANEYYTIDAETGNPIFVSDNSSGVGHFNFSIDGYNDGTGTFSLSATEFKDLPFTFELYKNGEKVDTRNSNTIVKYKWFMKTFSYGNPGRRAESNFIISDATSEPKIKYKPVLYTNDNYNTDSEREYMPSNILCCEITYKLDAKEKQTAKTLTTYAYLPIVKIINRVQQGVSLIQLPKLNFDITKGYSEVVYNKDGTQPSYEESDSRFYIQLDERMNTNKGSFKVVGINGRTTKNKSYKYSWYRSNNLTISELEKNANTKSIIVTPEPAFKGDSSSNGILFRYVDSVEIDSDTYNINSYVHIPILLHLNLFGMGAFNKWDGVSIETNDDDGYIIAPQVIAGSKDEQNKFTGVIMGDAKDSTQKDLHPGLYSYYQGDKTFGVYADSGYAFFGKHGAGQIVIDPSVANTDTNINGSCYLYSSGFFEASAYDSEFGKVKAEAFEYLNKYERERLNKTSTYYRDSGMLIDMTNGGIYYGNGNFIVDSDGNMTSVGGHIWNGKYIDRDGNLTNTIERGMKPNEYEEAFLDLNPSTDTYQLLLKYKKNLQIYKEDGAILSAGGHFSNMSGSMFVDFQNDEVDSFGKPTSFITTENGFIKDSSLNLTNIPTGEEDLYPERLTGFLLYCLNSEITPAARNFKNVHNIKFAITKNGNIIASKGKIGSFYLDEVALKTNLNTHEEGDITLSKEGFKLEKFIIPKYISDPNSYDPNIISNTTSIEQDINNLRFAISKNFAVDNYGKLYCQDMVGSSISTLEIKTSQILSWKAYSRDITVENIYGDVDFYDDISFKGDNVYFYGDANFNNLSISNTAYADADNGILYINKIDAGAFTLGQWIELAKDIRQINNINYRIPWIQWSSSDYTETDLETGHMILIYE